MNITKEQVIERFCKLATKVGDREFNHTLPHDCFCTNKGDFQFDEEVLDFIERCVEEFLS